THSLIHSLIHSLTHSLIHSLTHSLTHSFTYSFIHSLTLSHVTHFFPQHYISRLTLFFRWLQRQEGKKLAILEVGCGVSIHSIRLDAEALSLTRPNTQLIRINPVHFAGSEDGDVGLGMGALGGILTVLRRVEEMTKRRQRKREWPSASEKKKDS